MEDYFIFREFFNLCSISMIFQLRQNIKIGNNKASVDSPS